jgi:hypothetical protein
LRAWSEKRKRRALEQEVYKAVERLFVSALRDCGFVSDSLSVHPALTILGIGHAVSAKRGW